MVEVFRLEQYQVTISLANDEEFPNALREEWRNPAGELHREWDKPAVVVFAPETGEHIRDEYRIEGRLHREHGPAVIHKGQWNLTQEWWIDGELHRDAENGPAEISTDLKTGIVITESWWRAGSHHRIDGPAFVLRDPENGIAYSEQWFVDGLCHRNGGPAEIHRSEDTGVVNFEQWWKHGVLTREDGPAKILRNPETGQVESVVHVRDGVRRSGPTSEFPNP